MRYTSLTLILGFILPAFITNVALAQSCYVEEGKATYVDPAIIIEAERWRENSDFVAKSGEDYGVYIHFVESPTPNEGDNRVFIKAYDRDSFDNLVATETCDSTAAIHKINWGDGEGWEDAGDVFSVTHVFEAGTGCGEGNKITIGIHLIEKNSLVPGDATKLYEFDINVTKSGECGSCSSDTCDADPCNLSAYFHTDPSGGPSGVYYTSHPFNDRFTTLPFGSYNDAHNRGWRLLEDRHAGLASDAVDDYIILTAGGKQVERLIEVGGKYYSETSDATGVFASGAVTIYRNEKNTEYYSDQITANVDYAITSATDSLGRVTTWTYTTDTTPPKKRLTAMTLPGGRVYSATWQLDSSINRYLLERIVSPDGFRLKFGFVGISPGVDRMQVARRVDQSNGNLIFEETYFTHSATPGETQLITQYASNKLVNGTLTSVSHQYTTFDHATNGGRVTQNEEVTTAGTLTADNAYQVLGYERGSSQTTLQDGKSRRYLITNLSPTRRRIVRETRNEFSDLVASSTELYDRVHGVVLASTDIHGTTRSYVYNFNPPGDAKHRLDRVNEKLSYTSYGYDMDNRVTGLRTTFLSGGAFQPLTYDVTTYDDDDRVTSVTHHIYSDEPQTATYYGYNVKGNPTRTLTYDNSKLLTQSSSHYDANGFILSSTDAEGRRTYYGYNGDYQMTEVGINDATTTMDYDVHGRLVELVLPLGNATEYDYTPVGQTRRVTQYLDVAGSPVAVTTTFEYDEGGYGKRLTAVRDAKNQKTGYVYNPWGRLAAEVIYEGTTSYTVKAKASYHYDAMGRVLAATSFSRIPTKYVYDDLGRLAVKQIWRNDPLIEDATGVKIRNVYNDLGQLSSVEIDDTSGCGCVETKLYAYDAHGRMAWHTGVVEDSTLSYTYDDFGQLAGVEYPKDSAIWASRAALDYTYDLLGRIATLDDGAAADPLARYRYNMASEISDVTYANGARVKHRYDAAGQVAAVTNYAESGTVMSLFQYSYNSDGLRTRVDREDGSYLTYEYDTLNRLTKEEKKNSGGTVLWRNRFSYDVVGNRTKWHKFVTSSTKTYTYAYDTFNQLTRYDDGTLAHDFEYDLNGNRILEEVYWGITLTGKRHFKWDQDDRLVQVRGENAQGDTTTTWVFRYCRTCSGNRTERIRYTGDPVNENIDSWIRYEMEGLNHLRIDERYDSPGDANSVIDGNDPWRVQRVYYNGPGQLGQIVKATVWDYTSTPTPTDYYYGYDILGNVSVISNNSGAEVDQFEQDAFGNEVEGSWSSSVGGITEHLTTKQYDTDLGLYYFNARWYDSASGSFVSRDPAYAVRSSEARIFPYAIADDSPINYVDPNGEETCSYIAKRFLGFFPLLGRHVIYVEESNDDGDWKHWSTELFAKKVGFMAWVGDPNNEGPVSGRWNGANQAGDSFFDPPTDVSQYCNKRCLRNGGGCTAWSKWINMPRPSNSKEAWADEYRVTMHNSNDYIACLVESCCPDLPFSIIDLGYSGPKMKLCPQVGE